MINDFHFSHEFLSCNSLKISVVNDAILDSWLNYGCLIIPKNKLNDYFEWLQIHDPKHVQKWKTAFSHYLTEDMPENYKSISSLKKLNECFDYIDIHHVPTLLINQDEVTHLNISNGRHSRDSLEIVNINNFNESEHFRNSKNLENCSILSGDDIQQIWITRFDSIAKKSKKITIIDRYFSKNLKEDIGCRVTSIERFIDFLSNTGRKYSISIFSSGDEKYSETHNTLSYYIDKTLSNRPNFKNTISLFEINSCEDSLFIKDAHDRFIQFDDYTVLLGTGMAIFRSFNLSASKFSFYRSAKDPMFSTALSNMNKNIKWKHKI